MMCEKCQIRQATIHLTEIIKDVKSEVHLCEHCAREVGFNSKISNFTISIPEMLSFLEINELEKEKNVLFCHSCGLTLAEFKKTNKMGCANCYNHYRDMVESLLLSRHGEKRHVGKNPRVGEIKGEMPIKQEEIQPALSLSKLKDELDRAVNEERYEEAAVIRDRLKNLPDGLISR